jgi:type I restriction enzyme, S subunit
MSAELMPGYKQTEVGVIPEDWNAPLLDSIAKRGSGHTPDKKRLEYWSGPIKWISLKDSDVLDNIYIEDTAATITSAGIANSSAIIHPAGTVVLSRDAGVGKSAITKSDMAVSQHFMAWQCGRTLHNIFLYYWLQASKPEFERIAMGNTIKTIGLPYFRTLRVPIPSIQEQRAIAAALSDVDALINGLDQLIAKKRDIKQAAMQQLLTGQTRLPGFIGEWEARRLGDESELITKGTTPTSLGRNFVKRGINFVKVESLTADGIFIPEMLAAVDKETHRILKRSQLRENDILFSIAGALGRTAIVNVGLLPANTNQALAIIRLNPYSCLRHGFLLKYLSGPQITAHIAAINVQAAQANLSLEDIRNFVVPAPSTDEQTAIATILSGMDADLASLEARRDKTRALKQGMMQELLTGRIRLA